MKYLTVLLLLACKTIPNYEIPHASKILKDRTLAIEIKTEESAHSAHSKAVKSIEQSYSEMFDSFNWTGQDCCRIRILKAAINCPTYNKIDSRNNVEFGVTINIFDKAMTFDYDSIIVRHDMYAVDRIFWKWHSGRTAGPDLREFDQFVWGPFNQEDMGRIKVCLNDFSQKIAFHKELSSVPIEIKK